MTNRFIKAIINGDAASLRDVMRAQPSVLDARTSAVSAPGYAEGSSGLHIAVQAGCIEVVKILLDAGINVEARSKEGRTALHDALEFGHTEIRTVLLDAGALVDTCSAAILGDPDRVHALLDSDPALVNDRSTHLSPLGWAAFGNQVETATVLLERGARMDDGELLCAALVGHVKVGRLLIAHGADPNELFADTGCNALHAAATLRHTSDSRPFIAMLLKEGADVSIQTKDGKTALAIAEEKAIHQARSASTNPDGRYRDYEAVASLLRGVVSGGGGG